MFKTQCILCDEMKKHEELTPTSMAISCPLLSRLEMFFRPSGSFRTSTAFTCFNIQFGKPSATGWSFISSIPDICLHWGGAEWGKYQAIRTAIWDKLSAEFTHFLFTQMFLDKSMQLAPCPSDVGSQIFESLCEIVGRDCGNFFGRQCSNNTA